MGLGAPALVTSQRRIDDSPPGPPFAPISGDNGISISEINGKIELGNDLATLPGNSQFFVDRFIDLAGHDMNFFFDFSTLATAGIFLDGHNGRLSIVSDSALINPPLFDMQDRSDGSNATLTLADGSLHIVPDPLASVIIERLPLTPSDGSTFIVNGASRLDDVVFNSLGNPNFMIHNSGVPGLTVFDASFVTSLLRLTQAGQLFIEQDTTLLHTGTSLSNGAGAGVGTLLNAPSGGNPSKWVPIDDNGVTRFVPTWTV